jgi:hypothetical protein
MSELEQIKYLENGKGIQYLMDSAYKIFNNPVYMVDSNYNLIAASDGPMEIISWGELIKTGTFPLPIKERMAKANVYENVANTQKAMYMEKRGTWDSGLVTGRIVNRDKIWIGQMTMHEFHTSLNAESLAAFELLVDKVTLEIRDYDYFTKLSIAFFEDTVKKLLDSTTEITIIHHSQARIVRHSLEKHLYVAVVSVARNNILENVHRNRLAYFQSLLNTRYKLYRYAIYADKILILMSSQFRNYSEALPLGRDYDLFEINDLYAGVSASFENIFEFRNYYDQAIDALKDGMKSNSGQRIFLNGDT